MSYQVLWDNGHACGTLYSEFDSLEDAEDGGKDWKAYMVGLERTPERRAEAEEEYTWEVIKK